MVNSIHRVLQRGKQVLLFLSISGLIACTTSTVPESKHGASTRKLFWPTPPAEPRLTFVRSITSPADLGIEKNRLRLLIAGQTEVKLIRPTAITTGPAGELYIADPGIKGIHFFDTRKNRYHQIRGEQGLALPSPVGLASGPAGEVYIADSRLSAVFLISPGSLTATRVPLQTLLAQPTGLAIEPASGRLYLVDTGSHQVKVFARDGALLKRIGKRGRGEGEFNFPTMIWLNKKGQLLVSDSMNFRIQSFDLTGRFLWQFGEVGNRPGWHAQPKGIATDSEGHIYIVDSLQHRLQIFNPLGRLLLSIGQRGIEHGEFWLPAGIHIDAKDTIYIADSYNQRVQVLRYLGGNTP